MRTFSNDDAKKEIARVISTDIEKISDVFDGGFPSVIKMSLDPATKKQLKGYIAALLIQVNECLSVPEMSDTMRSMIADLVVRDYKHMNLADLKLCMMNGISGKYGKIFNRVDVEVVLGWCKAYWEERLQEAELVSQREHEKAKKETSEPITDEQFAENMQKLKDTMKANGIDVDEAKKEDTEEEKERFKKVQSAWYYAASAIKELEIQRGIKYYDDDNNLCQRFDEKGQPIQLPAAERNEIYERYGVDYRAVDEKDVTE